jgi:ribosomal protein S18 acetylase RimI-like enzyme
MLIRQYAPDDERAVVTLWSDAGLTRPWNDPRKDIARKASVQPELFLVAEDNRPAEDDGASAGHGAIIGTVMAGYDGHRGWINYLAVRADRRGTGVARLLIGRAERGLAALGCPKVHLQIRPENEGVAELYAHLGYERYAVIDMGKRLVDDEP